jgi:hypothetical protein
MTSKDLEYWLTSNADAAIDWRATAPLSELSTALVLFKERQRKERKKMRLIDLAETGLEGIKAEAADLAKSDRQKLSRYIDDLSDAADKRLAELEQMHNGGQAAAWKQERHETLSAEVGQLRDVLEILERAKRGY